MGSAVGHAEKMTPQETFNAVNNLKHRLEENFIQLGQLLSAIKRQKLYAKKGYQSFREFVETEFRLNGALAGKLCAVYDLYIDNLDMDEGTVKQIGFDRLTLVKPLVAKADTFTQDDWIEKAETLPLGQLKQEIKQLKDKQKDKDKDLRAILVDQYLERMRTEFNCSQKDINFKLALYFQDMDLEEVKQVVKTRQRQFESQTQEAKEAKK